MTDPLGATFKEFKLRVIFTVLPKFAVIVPGAPIVADVEADFGLVTLSPKALLLQEVKAYPDFGAALILIELPASNHPDAGVTVPELDGDGVKVTLYSCKNRGEIVPDLLIVPLRFDEGDAIHLCEEVEPAKVEGDIVQEEPLSNHTELGMVERFSENGDSNSEPEKIGFDGAILLSETV